MKHHSPVMPSPGGCAQKQPCAGVMPGSGNVKNQMNPQRDRTKDYTPSPQARETGV